MELLYVWIEDYKNIYHQGFNFSPRYRFKFEPQLSDDKKSVIGGTLTEALEEKFKNDPDKATKILEERKNVIPDEFFNPDQEDGCNIANVTGIIGENGSGKSTLVKGINEILNFLKYRMRTKFQGNPKAYFFNSEFVLVFSNENKEKIIFSSKKDIYDNELGKLNYVDLTNKEEDKIENTSNAFDSIFLSNVFDGRTLDFPYIRNLSTNHLAEKSHYVNVINFFSEEFLRQVNFLFEMESYKNFSLPFIKNLTKIQIRILKYKYQDGFNKAINDKIGNKKDSLNNIFNKSHINASKNNFKLLVLIQIFYNLIYYDYNTKQKDMKYDDDAKNIINKIIETWEKNCLDNPMAWNLGLEKIPVPKKSNTFDSVISFIKNWDEKKYGNLFDTSSNISPYPNSEEQLLKGNDTSPEKNDNVSLADNAEDDGYYTYEIDFNENKEVLKYFIEDYLKTFGINSTHFIQFNWPGLSSGQMAMFNLFSRFHYLRKKDVDDKNLDLSKNIVVFIDEGELYFHPQWQKSFLKDLLVGLKHIFYYSDDPKTPSKRNIQLVLTSHSPFVLSDIPKDNLIFLKQGKNGECLVYKEDELKGLEKTFAQNIHTLFTSSYFLQDGLMGEFAKGKISEIKKFYERVKNFERILSKNDALKNKFKNNRNRKKSSYKKVLNRINNFWKIQKIIGEEYLAQIIKNHLEEIEWILLEKKPSNLDRIQKLLELEQQNDTATLEKIEQLLKNLKEKKQNDKN